jgi:prolyl-tRNA editing enzyme YbaK/EbsC (Cys-tRNA(Pro) deacylase)
VSVTYGPQPQRESSGACQSSTPISVSITAVHSRYRIIHASGQSQLCHLSCSILRIFISHNARDKPLARDINSHLPPWLRPWIDEERLLLGSELGTTLREVIDFHVDYVVLLFSNEAAESAWVRQEILWALEREDELGRTFLLPVLLGNAADLRARIADMGLDGRFTLEISTYKTSSARILAEELVEHLGAWMSARLAATAATSTDVRGRDSLGALDEALPIIASIPAAWREEVEALLVRPFLDDLKFTPIGTIPLTPVKYYQGVLGDMNVADAKTTVLAVSTLSSELWSNDAEQTAYVDRNLEAVRRGTRIKRLFVVPPGRAHAFADAIRYQDDEGIAVRVGSQAILARVPDLEDFVLFEGSNGARAYVANATIDGSRRIGSGTLVLDARSVARRREAFEIAWGFASDRASFFDSRQSSATPPTARSAPGLRFRARHVAFPVVTCKEASEARGIPLERELKTLIVQTRDGMVAVHLPGNKNVSLRKVKARLEAVEAYLADPEDLDALGMSAGTVSAVLEPVWSMPHLISRRVLSFDTVMTNNGTKTGYFEFRPEVLVEASDVIVDDFER